MDPPADERRKSVLICGGIGGARRTVLKQRCRSRHGQTAAGRAASVVGEDRKRRFGATEPAASLKCADISRGALWKRPWQGSRQHGRPDTFPRGFLPVSCPRKPKPLLAFWKCHPIHPEAFQPVKLKQRCKAATLMKCINLERRTSILIAVWFVYEPSEEQRGTRRRLRGVLPRRRLCNGPYTHTLNNSTVSSPRMPMMKFFFSSLFGR